MTAPGASRVVRNATTNVGRFVLSLVVHVLLTPFLVHRLGAAGYGLWSLALAALGFVGLAEFGFGTAVVRATAQTSGDPLRRSRVLSTVAAVHAGLALLAVGAVAVVAWGLGDWFAVPPQHLDAARQVVWLLGLRVALVALPFGFFRNVLFGEQHIAAINAVQSASALGYAVAAWVALSLGGDVVTLAWLNLGAGVAEHLAYVVLVRRRLPGLVLSPRGVDRRLLPSLVSFSGATFLISVSALVLLRTDPLIVQLGLGLGAVAVYAIALKIAEYGHLLTKQAINVLSPVVARLHADGELGKVRTVLVDVSRHTLWAGSTLAAGSLVLGGAALGAWVGPDFATAAPALSVLMLAMTLLIPQMVAANVLMMTGGHRFMATASVLAVVINVGVSAALVSTVGLTGVALGTLAATVLVDCGYVLWRACRLHGFGYLPYLRRVFLPAAACGAVQVAVTAAVASAWALTSLWQVVLAALPGLAASAALYGRVFLREDERAWVRARLRRPRRRDTLQARTEVGDASRAELAS